MRFFLNKSCFSLPYTEAVIREILRITPINPFGIPRRCTQNTYLRGYFIPKVI